MRPRQDVVVRSQRKEECEGDKPHQHYEESKDLVEWVIVLGEIVEPQAVINRCHHTTANKSQVVKLSERKCAQKGKIDAMCNYAYKKI